MTTKFNNQDKVWLHNEIPATVIYTARNGIVIEYWGRGFREGQLCTQRVAAKYLTPRTSRAA